MNFDFKNTFLALLGILFFSCDSYNSKKDEAIDSSLRYEISQLDHKVLKAVVNKQADKLKALMSEELLKQSSNNIGDLVAQVSKDINTVDHDVMNRFHILHSEENVGYQLSSGEGRLNDYYLKFLALNKEMFVSTLVPKTKGDQYVITIIYGKYPQGWRINIIQFGKYTIYDKTAPEWYETAKNYYDKGYILDAMTHIFMSSRVAKPANAFWKYQKEEEMISFENKIMNELNTRFPLPNVIDAIPTRPIVFSIHAQAVSEGVFPMIEYVSGLDLNDTIETKKEFEQLHQSIADHFKGVSKNNDYIFYKAYNEIPTAENNAKGYGFVMNLKTKD